jgi:hypothetical protein
MARAFSDISTKKLGVGCKEVERVGGIVDGVFLSRRIHS